MLTPTTQSPTLQPPTGFRATAFQGVIQLDWSSIGSGWSFRVKRSAKSGGPYATITTVTQPISGYSNYYTYKDTTAAPGVHYYYVASALDGLKESANSAEASAIVLVPPSPPTGLTASIPRKSSAVSLTWTQSTSPEIQWNRVYRSTNRGSDEQIAQINPGSSYQDNLTANRTSYSHIVTAVNANGLESPYSNAATVRTK